MEAVIREGQVAPESERRKTVAVPDPSDGIAVWLLVTGAKRPNGVASFVKELAEPDFELEACEESGRIAGDAGAGYRAHWYCQFIREAQDEFADVRLLKRLIGAGFRIVRFNGTMMRH